MSLSWEADNLSANKCIACNLYHKKFRYRFSKCRQLFQCSANWIKSTPSKTVSLRCNLILSSLLRLDFPIGLFPLGLSTKTFYAFIISPFILRAQRILSTLCDDTVDVFFKYFKPEVLHYALHLRLKYHS